MQTTSQTIVDSPHRSLRVCFISLSAYPLFNPDIQAVFGGAEVDLYLLATELAADPRFDVRFVVGDYGQPPIEQRQNVMLIKSLDVRRSYFFNVRKIWKALRQADADIYVQEACSLLTTTIALFCKLRHRRFVYRTASNNETNGTYFRRHPFRGWLVRWAFRAADTRIVQNQEDQRRFSNIGLESTMIRNACRLREVKPARREFVLWVGRSEQVKRPDLFIQLAQSIPDISFLMICSRAARDEHYENLVHLAASVPNLKFIPGLPFEQIEAFFEKAILYINTSDSEGFPNTFVQACKSGTPILSLNINPDDFLNRHQCGLCARGDWGEFLKMARQMLMLETAAKLGQNGRLYAEKNHDIKQIIEVYKTLFLNRPGRGNYAPA
ncbi:MAG: glycosyltransferase family 4 protein [Planctomycetes bacterium]|nr:glycosyltransferase family 4 protein [Planctomycetota bacterium]